MRLNHSSSSFASLFASLVGFKAPVHGDEQEELPDFVKEAREEFMVLYTSLYDQRIKV